MQGEQFVAVSNVHNVQAGFLTVKVSFLLTGVNIVIMKGLSFCINTFFLIPQRN